MSTKIEPKKKRVEKVPSPEKKKRERNSDDIPTRDIILATSLDIVNEIGVVDFRIDMISARLGLSPGNITYHFSKKETLCHALWIDFIAKLSPILPTVTPLLDIKQSFIIFRILCARMYAYRGIIMSRNSDIHITQEDDASQYSFKKFIDEIFESSYRVLLANGYISEKESFIDATHCKGIVKDIYSTAMRSWINMKHVTVAQGEVLDLQVANQGALLIMFSLYPIMTPQSKEAFQNIKQVVEEGKLPVTI